MQEKTDKLIKFIKYYEVLQAKTEKDYNQEQIKNAELNKELEQIRHLSEEEAAEDEGAEVAEEAAEDDKAATAVEDENIEWFKKENFSEYGRQEFIEHANWFVKTYEENEVDKLEINWWRKNAKKKISYLEENIKLEEQLKNLKKNCTSCIPWFLK